MAATIRLSRPFSVVSLVGTAYPLHAVCATQQALCCTEFDSCSTNDLVLRGCNSNCGLRDLHELGKDHYGRPPTASRAQITNEAVLLKLPEDTQGAILRDA